MTTKKKTLPKSKQTPQTKEARDFAQYHSKTRKAHAAEVTEDYVEAIADLIRSSGEARVVELARRLGVSHVSVVRVIQRLQKEGLVETKPYRAIFLSDHGATLASRIEVRHNLVVDFLQALGVPEQVAHGDAEGIEHHVSEETLRAFSRFLKNQ